MTLSLSPHDQSLVAAATRALVSPLVAPSFEEWLREVNRTLKELLWADKASFMFALPGGEVRAASEEYTPPELETYVRQKLPETERRWGLRRRSVELGAYNRALLYGRHRREIYRSDYYNEYLVAKRAFDPVCMTTTLDASHRVVNLYFHHDRPTGRRFGPRGLALVRMLYPAFKAGVHASHVLFVRRRRVSDLVDAVPGAVALTDAAGRIVHMNRALVSVLEAESDRAALETQLTLAAEQCIAGAWRLRSAAGGAQQIAVATGGVERRVVGRHAVYTITATALEAEPLPHEASIAVLVTRRGRAPFPEDVLRQRFALTAREVEVARLLGDGTSNGEIARSLGISLATARHHTEAVMFKLGVSSRARIPALLAALTIA